MLPRKSSVFRYAVCVFVSCALLFIWLSRRDTDIETSWMLSEPDLLLANESQLWWEINELQANIDSQKLNLKDTLPPNITADKLRQHIADMRRLLPVNPHRFRYIINPSSACAGRDVFLLVYIHSAPAHFKKRMSIRETWGNAQLFAPNYDVKLVFLCGVPAEMHVQDALLMESDTYGDIVQENFLDSYRNLTYKGIMGLKWVSTYCPQARFLLKTDDDIFVNMFSLLAHLRGRLEGVATVGSRVTGLLLCLVWTRMKVVREPSSKWYLSRAEYPSDYFPTYCSGSAFILTPDVAANMFTASLRTPFFWVDDFYVTGLLAGLVNVKHEKFNAVYTLQPKTFLPRFTAPTVWKTLIFGHVHNINHMKIVWNNVLRERTSDAATVNATRKNKL